MPKILNFAYQIDPNWSLLGISKCGSTTFDRELGGKYPKYEAKDELPTKGAIAVIRHPVERILSYYRDFRVRLGAFPTNHAIPVGISPIEGLDAFCKALIATPDELRDPHFCSYGRYTACAEIVHYVALEKLSATWPKGLPIPFNPDKKHRSTEKDGVRPSPEVEEALAEAFYADVLLWEEAVAKAEEDE